MRFSNRRNSRKSGDLSADAASRQRQILDRLSADYSRHVHELLRHRELIKGSVYEIQTRCGNPSCHCAKPRGVRHAAPVLCWTDGVRSAVLDLEPSAPVARPPGQTAPAGSDGHRPAGAELAAAAPGAEPAHQTLATLGRHVELLNYRINSMTSPVEVGPLARTLSSANLDDDELQVLIGRFAATFERLSSDDRSFSAALPLTEREVRNLVERLRARAVTPDTIISAYREWLIRSFKGRRCTDTIGERDPLTTSIAAFNRALATDTNPSLAPIVAGDEAQWSARPRRPGSVLR